MFDDAGIPVRISSASMRQVFHGCEPDYIRDVCHGACCRSTVHPDGISVVVHPDEASAVAARGAIVHDGFIRPINRRCPYQADGTHLCDVHDTDAKPFGCVVSPFILTSRDTLVVRNRYRRLRCYRDGERPAYVAFRGSLVRLFGDAETERIAAHLGDNGSDISARMLPTAYRTLRDTQAIRHTA